MNHLAVASNENIIFQMQEIFSALELSQKEYYNLKNFCLNFLDYDNCPIDIKEQKDVFEFLTLLFDKMDTNLKSSAQNNFLT